MAPEPSSLDELLEQERRAHAIQIAVLIGLVDEIAGKPGKSWRELKAELKHRELRG